MLWHSFSIVMDFKNITLVLITLILCCCVQSEVDIRADKVNSHRTHLSDSNNLERTSSDKLSELNQALRNKTLENYAQLAYQKNRLHYSLGQFDSLAHFHRKFFLKTDLKVDSYYAAKQYYLMGYYYDQIVKDSDSAFKNYTISKNFYERIGDSSWVGRNLLNMGTIQKDQSDFFGSKETLTESLKYLQPIKDDRHISSCYNILATNHRKLSNLQDALKYYSKAIRTTNSPSDKLIYQNNLTATHIDNKQFNIAIQLLQKITKDSLLIINEKEYARALDNMAYAQWLLGEKLNEHAFLNPLLIRKESNDKRGQIASYTRLGEFYSKNAPIKAKQYFDTVIQLSKAIKMPRAEKDALKFLMSLEPKNVGLRDRYIFLQDSLYSQGLKVKTQFAKYKYDDKLKQESILRLEKENTEKELEASRQRNQKIIYLGGLLFITSILGLSLYGFRQRTKRLKQKSKVEKLEAIYEAEAQLSRRLHDDYGGKINQTMLMLQRGTDKSAILDKLETVYNQIRSFSREINTVDTGPDFWNSLKATLEYLKPVEVEMVFDGGKELDWSLVSRQAKTIIFKVLQELVKNMSQHSKAKQTVILFRDKKKELSIYYEDDGVGASKKSLLRKNGLRNTEKRIQALGGSITFDSEEQKGFRAEIRIPK